MEDEKVNTFREKIMKGDYEDIDKNLRNFEMQQAQHNQIEYLIHEQQYMELLSANQKLNAIKVLQKQLLPKSMD